MKQLTILLLILLFSCSEEAQPTIETQEKTDRTEAIK